MTTLDLPDEASGDGTSVLSWLQSLADRNQPSEVAPTIIPVAWMGRTSTDDQQDPTLAAGWNIGKPPYGYLAERHPHPVKAKRDGGKVKTWLVPDPVRGPVTQIFQWRALQRLGAQDIANRLNTDLGRYPPPLPIPGKGRRAVGVGQLPRHERAQVPIPSVRFSVLIEGFAPCGVSQVTARIC